MDVGKFNEHRLYTGLKLDCRLRLWARTSYIRITCFLTLLLLLSNMP